MTSTFSLLKTIKVFLLGLVFFLNPFSLTAETNPKDLPPVPWEIGEKLHFTVKVTVFNAGKASMSVEKLTEIKTSTHPKAKPVPLYHIVATAQSNKFVDLFYKVRDRNESWLDARKMKSHRFEQHNREGKYILDQIITYDWYYNWFKNTKNVKGRDPKIVEGPLTIPVVDTLSSLYLVRQRELKVGDVITLDVLTSKQYPLAVKVLKREKVRVPAGKFDCFKVQPFLREDGIFVQKGKKLQVWITADERRIPVLMKAEIFIGHVAAKLVSIGDPPPEEEDDYWDEDDSEDDYD